MTYTQQMEELLAYMRSSGSDCTVERMHQFIKAGFDTEHYHHFVGDYNWTDRKDFYFRRDGRYFRFDTLTKGSEGYSDFERTNTAYVGHISMEAPREYMKTATIAHQNGKSQNNAVDADKVLGEEHNRKAEILASVDLCGEGPITKDMVLHYFQHHEQPSCGVYKILEEKLRQDEEIVGVMIGCHYKLFREQYKLTNFDEVFDFDSGSPTKVETFLDDISKLSSDLRMQNVVSTESLQRLALDHLQAAGDLEPLRKVVEEYREMRKLSQDTNADEQLRMTLSPEQFDAYKKAQERELYDQSERYESCAEILEEYKRLQLMKGPNARPAHGPRMEI